MPKLHCKRDMAERPLSLGPLYVVYYYKDLQQIGGKLSRTLVLLAPFTCSAGSNPDRQQARRQASPLKI